MKTFLPIILFVIIVAAIVGIGYSMNKAKNNKAIMYQPDPKVTAEPTAEASKIDKTALAKYLTEKGAIMYGAYWCTHCKAQKEAFGDAFQYINYVECDKNGENAKPDQCVAAGIEGYPTWIINGQKHSGEQSFQSLADFVGFAY